MGKRAVFVLVLMTSLLAAAAAQLPRLLLNEGEAEQFEREFLEYFISGDFEAAFAVFRTPVSSLSESEIDSLEASTSSQLAGIRASYGQPIDARLARRKDVESLLLRREYLLRYEFLPLRAEFVYYFDGSVYRLTYFGWDDNFASLLSD